MHSARLVAILMDLTQTSQTTVGKIAAQHGVSERTAQRDIAALHQMGVPIWTRTGPDGGVGLIEGWRSPLKGMTSPELQALVIGEGASRDLGMRGDFKNALLKMMTSASPQTDALIPAQERILIDHEQWFSSPERPAELSTVAEAVWSGLRLAIRYQRPGREPVSRLLDPLGLVLKTGSWYLAAAHRRSLRTYRVSRILSAQVRPTVAWRPAEFSLADYWSGSRAEFESAIFGLSVRLSIPSDSAAALRASVPGTGTEVALRDADTGASRIELNLSMERVDIAAAQLLSVPGVEVSSPVELRRALYQRGIDLVERHRPERPETSLKSSTVEC